MEYDGGLRFLIGLEGNDCEWLGFGDKKEAREFVEMSLSFMGTGRTIWSKYQDQSYYHCCGNER